VSGGKLACILFVFFCLVTHHAVVLFVVLSDEFNRRDFRAKFGRLINSKYVMMCFKQASSQD